MKWFYNLNVAVKLIMGFIIVALIAGTVGVVGILNIKTIEKNDTELYEKMTVPLAQMSEIAAAFQMIRVSTRDIILSNDEDEIKKQVENINSVRAEINQNVAEFEKLIVSTQMRDAFNEFTKTREAYLPLLEQLIQIASENKDTEAFALLNGDMVEAAHAEMDAIDKLVSMKVNDAKVKSDGNTKTADTATLVMIVFICVGMLLAIFLGLFISRIISNPVKQMAQAADMLALGDINVNVKSDTKDEIGSLAKSFDKMIANIRGQALAAERIAAGDLTVEVTVKSENDLLGKKLAEMVQNNNEILTNIASASEQVAAGSRQVSDSSMALSQGATEQASSIEQLTASLEEISSQTKLNADNANQANELAENAKTNAVQGNNQMKEMLKAMEDINESSANISKIIKVIDDIAFQTNILALNAAVEAARAGQHGKGFAVVAEEVRNLAARSANAAKETTDMIEGSIKKAEGGTKIAQDTAEALNKIVNGIEKVANLVSNIAIASNEQAAGIGQINQGIMQVSQVVQSNSATSEESAAASEELSSQATLLKEMVSRFKLKQNYRLNNRIDELSPEVLKMLEGMAQKKNNHSEPKKNNQPLVNKPKIALSDNEFGKY